MPTGKNKKFNWFKKFIAAFTVFFLVLEISSFILLYPKTAFAFPVTVMNPFITVVADIPAKITNTIQKIIKTTSAVAFKNTIKGFMNKIAYDAAVYVASGGRGQKPLFMTKDWYKVLGEEANKEYGNAVDRLVRTWIDGVCTHQDGTVIEGSKCTEDFDCMSYLSLPISAEDYVHGLKCVKPNISLCDQPSPVKIKLGIWVKEVKFPKPYTLTEQRDYCPLSEMWQNISGYALDFYNTKKGYYEYLQQIVEKKDVRSAMEEVSKTFNQGSSTVSMFFQLYYGTQEIVDAKVESKKLEALIDKGWLPLRSKITGIIKTPASLIQNTFESLVPKSMEPYLQFTGETVADAIGVFFNTLTSQLLKKVYVKGINPETTQGGGGFAGIPTGGISQGVAAAKSIFASLKQPDYNVPGHKDILSELVSCPNAGSPGVNECVIDEGFKTAIENKLTLKEAIEQGLIDGSRTFGFNSQGMEPDFMSGYPYRSLVILRKYRIIPVGWELAAEYIRDYVHENWGIRTLMDKFDECGMCATNDGTPPTLPCRNDNQCTCTNCTGVCLIDQASSFCGLVDPNWVLKAPEVYCKKEGAGPQIISENWATETLSSEEEVTFSKAKTDEKNQISRLSVERASYCADEQSCVVENEDGSCKKFGYCMEERPVWKFHGEQCENYYNSCQSFTPTSGGAQVSYLKNTLDYNNCNIDNTGCQWYCQDWDKANSIWSCTADAGDKMNFNKQVGQCDQANDGCDEFISIEVNNGTNLLKNTSFENFEGTIDDGAPDKFGTCSNTWGMCSVSDPDCAASPIGSCLHWLNSGGVNTQAVSDAYFGTAAMKISGGGEIQGIESVGYKQNNRTFTFSYYAKVAAACSGGFGLRADAQESVATADYTAEWQKYSISYTFPDLAAPGYTSPYNITAFIRVAAPCEITIDGVQLEEGTSASNFKNYGEANRIYLNGNRDTCTEDQVGCELYTPVAGGEPVTGIITNPGLCDPTNPASCDQCPAAYAGCKAYREMPIEHMPYRAATDPLSFVADTGKTCPSTEVGCEEYTNLDEVAKGGEGKEYYSFIRLCVTPTSPNVNTYYTWEGSDEFGYQLKQYQLLKSDTAGDNGPCTNIDVDGWPACGDVAAGGPADCSDTCGGTTCVKSGAKCSTNRDCIDYQLNTDPDCTEFYDTGGSTYYRLMSRVVFATDHCLPYRNTYTSKDQCIDTNGDDTLDSCLISGENCDGEVENCSNEECVGAPTGTCAQTGVACTSALDCAPKIFHIDSDYCISCSSDNAGCREYKGSASHNLRSVLFSDFENGTIDPWTVNTPSGMNPSSESIRVGGHSMLVAGVKVNNLPTSYAYTDASTDIHKGKSYIISFWAKGAGGATDINASFVYDVSITGLPWGSSPNKLFPGQAKLKADQWNRYTLGPLYFSDDPPAEMYLAIFSEAGFYIDSISFQETVDDLYFIKDSYLKCSGYENCEHYKDGDGDDHYLKSFNKLCPVNKVGCELAIKTQNSENADRDRYVGKGARLRGDVDGDGKVTGADSSLVSDYLPPGTRQLTIQEQAAADANSDGIITLADVGLINQFAANTARPDPKWSDVWVAADELTFVVNNPAVYCSAQAKGCLKFGWPKFDKDGNVSNFNTVYLLNQPDQYLKTLCSHGDIGCAEYVTDDGQYFYFKNPGDTVCEYRKIAGYNAEGWYKKDSTALSPDCPFKDIGGVKRPTGVCSNNPTNQCDKDDDCGSWQAHCIHWVGTCPGGKSGCSEYRDPSDPVATNATTCNVTQANSCRSYYYIKSTIDTTSCNGMVYPDEGCLLFADQAQLNSDEDRSVRLIYDSQSTYKYIEEQRKALPPKVCASGGSECDSNIVLKVDRDRVCDKWLDCDKYVKVTTPKGEEQQLCYSLLTCNELNETTGACKGYAHCKNDTTKSCTSDADCSTCEIESSRFCSGKDANCAYCMENGKCSPDSVNAGADCPLNPCQTKLNSCKTAPTSCEFLGQQPGNVTITSPTRIDEIRYLSGYSKAGISVVKDKTTIEGYYPYAAMSQIGLGGSKEDDLVKYGDFGDSDMIFGPEPSITNVKADTGGRNQIPAGWWIRGRSCSAGTTGHCMVNPSEPCTKDSDCDEYPLGDTCIFSYCDAQDENTAQRICSDNNWGVCEGGIALMEEGDKGQIKNPTDDNLDENNILEVNTGNQGSGIYYDVGKISATPAGQPELGYVISFRIRYKDEPVETDRLTIGLATRDPTKTCTNNEKPCTSDTECKDAVTGNQLGGCVYGISEGYTETAMFQPSSQWQKYVSMPIIGFSGYALIKIVQSDKATGQTFYLDDVSLKPVLKANDGQRCVGGVNDGLWCLDDSYCDSRCKKEPSRTCNTDANCTYCTTSGRCSLDSQDLDGIPGPDPCSKDSDCVSTGGSCEPFTGNRGYCYYNTQIPRSCRIYPTSSSPMCKYTDDKGATYKGWYGYCLEQDPKNPDYCLQWWPVDLIQGESDVFGVNEKNGYDGRFPLYMCMEAKGNSGDVTNVAWAAGNKEPSLDHYKLSIPGSGGMGSGNLGDECSGKYPTQQCDSYAHDFAVYSWWDNTQPAEVNLNDIEHIKLRWTSDDSHQWGVILPDFTHRKIESGIIETFCLGSCADYQYGKRVDSNGDTIWMFWTKSECRHDPDYGYQCLWIDIFFQKDTGRLKQIRVAGEDGTGGAWEGGLFILEFYLREPCTYITQVVNPNPEDNNKAWAERIKSLSYHVYGVQYTQDQDFSPYGSLLPPSSFSLNKPETWDSTPDIFQIDKQPIYAERSTTSLENPDGLTRAGSAYDCWNAKGCKQTMCLGGEREGVNNCFTNLDCCENLSSDGKTCEDPVQGKCVGVGPEVKGGSGGGVWLATHVVTHAPPYIDLLDKLFVKTYGVWEFTGGYNNAKYEKTANALSVFNQWENAYNNMSKCPGTPPKRPGDFASEYCGVPPTIKGGKVIVRVGDKVCNNQSSPPCTEIKDIISGSNIEIEFVPQVDPEQVPLQKVMVDLRGKDKTGALPTEWQYNNETQMDRYVIGIKMDCTTSSKWFNGTECVYQPIIRLIDNWDWCSQGNGSDARYQADGDDCDTYFDSGITIHMKPTS